MFSKTLVCIYLRIIGSHSTLRTIPRRQLRLIRREGTNVHSIVCLVCCSRQSSLQSFILSSHRQDSLWERRCMLDLFHFLGMKWTSEISHHANRVSWSTPLFMLSPQPKSELDTIMVPGLQSPIVIWSSADLLNPCFYGAIHSRMKGSSLSLVASDYSWQGQSPSSQWSGLSCDEYAYSIPPRMQP